MGQYYQPPPPGYGAPPPQPYGMEHPEATSIKSMVNIASIFGIIMCLIALLWAIVEIYWWATFDAIGGLGDAASFVFLIYGIVLIVMFFFGLMFYMQCRNISRMVDQKQYEQAKSKTLIWMIIGILFVFFIPGILLLIAYLKFDPLINMTRAQGYGPAPQPYMQAPPPQQRVCLGCGQQIPLNFNNCPHCGRQAQPAGPAPQQHAGMRMCLGCGQQIQATYNVCPHCGKHMGQ